MRPFEEALSDRIIVTPPYAFRDTGIRQFDRLQGSANFDQRCGSDKSLRDKANRRSSIYWILEIVAAVRNQ
jgi:hypothetical protein